MGAVIFRAQILKCWEWTVKFLCSVLLSLGSLIYLTVGALFTAAAYLTTVGGFALGDFATMHFHPFVCMLLLDFALFLILVFNFYVFNNVALRKKIQLYVAHTFLRIRAAVVFLRRPRLVMLQ